jgi:hypothetical protein
MAQATCTIGKDRMEDTHVELDKKMEETEDFVISPYLLVGKKGCTHSHILRVHEQPEFHKCYMGSFWYSKALHTHVGKQAMNDSVTMNDHLSPAQARDVACEMRTTVHGTQHGIADAKISIQDPAEEVGGLWGMVASMLSNDRNQILVEPEVEFLIDRVKVSEGGRPKPNSELEKEIRMAEEGFVDIERSPVDVVGRHGDLRTPY